jgi:hypothetical protein
MFIWLKQLNKKRKQKQQKKHELPELGFKLQTSRFQSEHINPTTMGSYNIAA